MTRVLLPNFLHFFSFFDMCEEFQWLLLSLIYLTSDLGVFPLFVPVFNLLALMLVLELHDTGHATVIDHLQVVARDPSHPLGHCLDDFVVWLLLREVQVDQLAVDLEVD